MASFSLNVTFVYDSAELFHNDSAIQFRLGEPVVRIALGLPDQTLRSDAVLVFQQVVDILHPLLAQTPDSKPYISGYTNRTAISLTSVGGDITLVNRSASGNDFPVRDDLKWTVHVTDIQ